tara:strand:- start:888 stop:1415 length:528 start_codon:yes stop_codon:yes gene_type:complete
MAQEFTIKSNAIEDKINQLLPSQGGAGAGIDFSASTMVIPVVDLTESAEGGAQRQDLQSAISFTTATAFNVANTTTTIINTTGFWRIFGTMAILNPNSVNRQLQMIINDGTTDKVIFGMDSIENSQDTNYNHIEYDFIIKLEAGHSFIINSSDNFSNAVGSVRQIADVNGNLTNP